MDGFELQPPDVRIGQNTGTSGNIITHAPPSPFWDTNPMPFGNFSGAYLQVHQSIGQYIAWYNTQLYGNGKYDGATGAKIARYNQLAAAMGQPEKLLLGVRSSPTKALSTARRRSRAMLLTRVAIPIWPPPSPSCRRASPSLAAV